MGQVRAQAGRRKRGERDECSELAEGRGATGEAREARGNPEERSDDALVGDMLAGRVEAFDVVYNRYFNRVYGFVYSRVHSHADAEEIVQETFLAVFSSMDRYRGTSSLLSWVYGIARNLLNNHLRSAKRRSARLVLVDGERLDFESAPGLATPEGELEFDEYRQRLLTELEGLSSWQTEVFVLRHFRNLSIAEISRRTQRSSDSVRSSLFRIKRVFLEQVALESDSMRPKGVRS